MIFHTLQDIVKAKKIRGFSLIELLVVIAIIGLLVSVTALGINKARQSARFAAMFATFHSAQVTALECIAGHNSIVSTVDGSGGVVHYCGDGYWPAAPNSITPGTAICSSVYTGITPAPNSPSWPNTSQGWTYVGDQPPAYFGCHQNLSAGTFDFTVITNIAGSSCSITCTEKGCTSNSC